MFIDLLKKDPKKRLTLKQVMDHPWLKTDKVIKDKDVKTASAKFKNYALIDN